MFNVIVTLVKVIAPGLAVDRTRNSLGEHAVVRME